MANLRDVIAYICTAYPQKSELSKARLTKLVYLADWRASITLGRQVTPTQWVFNHYGPYVPDVEQLARTDSAFVVERTENFYGGQKEIIGLRQPITVSIDADERGAIDFAIEKTKVLSWDAFIKLIYSTYPIVTESRYEQLDLPALAAEYKNTFQERPEPAVSA